MGDFLNIIDGDYELLDENFYLQRIYDVMIKNNLLKGLFKKLGVHNVNFVTLENAINDYSNTYVYIVYKQAKYHFNENIKYFDEKLLSAIRNYKHIKLMYFVPDESFDSSNFKLIHDYITYENLNHEQIYIYNNNANMDIFVKNLNSNLKHYKSSYLAKSYSQFFNKITHDFVDNKNFLFLIQNRRLKSHRVGILCFLLKNKIIDITDWSFIENPKLGDLDYFNSDSERLFEKKEFNSELEYLCNLSMKKNYHEQSYEDKEYEKDFLNLETFCDSYINIVTESHFTEDDIHISEKSFKPFYFNQFPIIVSSYGTVKKMKELYGYDFFDDIINHNYDDEIDAKKRFNLICHEIMRLSKMKPQIENFYAQNRLRFEKNKQITLDLININESQFFYNL